MLIRVHFYLVVLIFSICYTVHIGVLESHDIFLSRAKAGKITTSWRGKFGIISCTYIMKYNDIMSLTECQYKVP